MKIRLFDIKEQLKIEGPYLLTRPLARQFIPVVYDIIKGNVDADVVEFDFKGIQSVDTSFIDELIIVNILKIMRTRSLPHKGVFFSHLTPSSYENAESVFLIQKIAITVKDEDNKEHLIGHLEQNLKKVLGSLWEKKKLRTIDLTKNLHLTKSVASTKLAALHRKFLATREEEISSKGREYTYYSL